MNSRFCACALIAACAISCVHYVRADSVGAPTFDALWSRDLSRFEQLVATERHTGGADDWTVVAQSWLAFASCEDVPDGSLADAGAEFARATVRAEDVRRRLEIVRAATARRRINPDLLGVDVTRGGFFDRGADSRDPGLIEWPAEEEGWADETPAAISIDSTCASFAQRVLDTRENPESDDSPRLNYEDWLGRYVDAVDDVERAYERLASDGASTAAAVAWESRFRAAYLQYQAAEVWRLFGERARQRAQKGVEPEKNRQILADATKRQGALRDAAMTELDELLRGVPERAGVDVVAATRLLLAEASVRDEKPARALALLARARSEGWSDANRWAGRYLELRLSADAARWDAAARLADALPPANSRLFGPYVYRSAVALKRTGATDRFLNVAMAGFRDRTYRADPFLRALYWEMLQTLAEYPFDDRVTEMLEEMGQRGGTFERVEEYARVALDRGRPENAVAAARWLLAHHSDARFHPRYHGIVALAAFLEDDDAAFRSSLAELGRRPSAVIDAVGPNRSATFFADADTELARVLRQMLPVMVEWGDDGNAQERRQRWLETIVSYSQEFVRNTQNTLARPQLVELYRLASALLEEHPRGYAERVGEEDAAPLVLGTVRVEGRDLREFEPAIELDVPTPYSLTIIPRPSVPMERWPTRWPVEGEGE